MKGYTVFYIRPFIYGPLLRTVLLWGIVLVVFVLPVVWALIAYIPNDVYATMYYTYHIDIVYHVSNMTCHGTLYEDLSCSDRYLID